MVDSDMRAIAGMSAEEYRNGERKIGSIDERR
jgi:hypothetical protein